MSQRNRPLLILAILFTCLAAGTGCGRPEAPEVDQEVEDLPLDIPSRFPGVQRLVAIGDLHGDLEAARTALADYAAALGLEPDDRGAKKRETR